MHARPELKRDYGRIIYTADGLAARAAFDACLKKCALENLNREFRRRTKTQVSFTIEAAAVALLFGLVALGHVALRKIDGHDHLPAFLASGQIHQTHLLQLSKTYASTEDRRPATFDWRPATGDRRLTTGD